MRPQLIRPCRRARPASQSNESNDEPLHDDAGVAVDQEAIPEIANFAEAMHDWKENIINRPVSFDYFLCLCWMMQEQQIRND